jgi:hypothetical protein
MTDLKRDSVQALVLAGRIAERCGLLLDVLYALGLRGLSLREAVPALQRLDQRITSIDRSVRSLIGEHFPHWEHVPGPVIDVDSAPVALIRRAAQLNPPIVVLSSSWNDGRDADRRRGVAALATIPAPVLITGRSSADPVERAVLVTAATPPQAFVASARDWVHWFHAVGDGSVFTREPSLDVVVVEDQSTQEAMAALVTHEPSLVLIPKPAMDGAMGGVMRDTVASFLAQHGAHALILPDSGPPRLRPGTELDLALVAAGA